MPAIAPEAPQREPLVWGLVAFAALLPLHALAIAYLYGVAGWPAPLVRGVAAWKELLVLGLLGWVLVRALRGNGSHTGVRWADLTVAGMAALAGCYLVGATWWFDQGIPVVAQLYGWRDAAFASLLYFVGRATPHVAEDRRIVRALVAVGIVTSAIAVLERLFVTPGTLVVLGATRYVQEFLGAALVTRGNVYGLPDNYWTMIGNHIVQRAGSTYLSSQGFAIPFLLIMPAATLWLLDHTGRRRVGAWLAYGLLWTGLLLTITRMTTVACVLQVVAIVAARRRWAMGLSLVTAGLAGFAVGLALFPELGTFVWDTVTWQTGSSQSHLADWSSAIANVPAHPLGAGLGSADFVAARFGVTALAADNQYLKYAVELGILGLIVHVLVLVALGAAGFRAWRCGTPAARRTGLLVAVATLGIAVNALTAVVMNSTLLAYGYYWLAGAATSAPPRSDRGAV